MNLLSLDTSFSACSAALALGPADASTSVLERYEEIGTGHAERIVPMIGELLREAAINPGNLSGILVTDGPGTFTGIRIGVAAARALALAIGKPVVAISSLELIALSPRVARGESTGEILVAMNARRDEAYLQVFDTATRRPRTPPALTRLEDVARLPLTGNVTCVGSAAREAAAALRSAGQPAIAGGDDILPRAADGLSRGTHLIGALDSGTAAIETVRPHYLRAPDAKPQDDKTLQRRA